MAGGHVEFPAVEGAADVFAAEVALREGIGLVGAAVAGGIDRAADVVEGDVGGVDDDVLDLPGGEIGEFGDFDESFFHAAQSIVFKSVGKWKALGLAGTLFLSGCVGSAITGTLMHPKPDYETLPEFWGLTVEPVAIPCGDLLLHGWFIPAPGGTEDAVLVCGGSDSNKSIELPFAQLLYNAGYSVLLFDYRGYGTSEGEADSYEIATDARAALAWLKTRAKRIVMAGHSMGAIATLAAGDDPAVPGVILEACPNPEMQFSLHLGFFNFVARLAIPPELRTESSVGDLRGKPILFIHGAKDWITPLREAIPVYERAGEKASFFVLENAGHPPGTTVAQKHTYTRLVTGFLDRTLRGKGDVPFFRPQWREVQSEGGESKLSVRLGGVGTVGEEGRVRLTAIALQDGQIRVHSHDVLVKDSGEHRIGVSGEPLAVTAIDVSDEAVSERDRALHGAMARLKQVEEKFSEFLWDSKERGDLTSQVTKEMVAGRITATEVLERIRKSENRDPAILQDLERELEQLSHPEVDVEVRKRMAKPWSDLGSRYMGWDQLPDARRCYLRSFSFFPENPEAYHDLGDCWWSFGFPVGKRVEIPEELKRLDSEYLQVDPLEEARRLLDLPKNPYEGRPDPKKRCTERSTADREWLKAQRLER